MASVSEHQTERSKTNTFGASIVIETYMRLPNNFELKTEEKQFKSGTNFLKEIFTNLCSNLLP